MKLLWLGLGAAAAYVLLSKKENGPPIVGPLPEGATSPPATLVNGLSAPSAPPTAPAATPITGVPSQPDAGFWNPEAEAMKQRIAEAELRAKAVLATATGACCPQGRICSATMPLCKSGPNLLSAW